MHLLIDLHLHGMVNMDFFLVFKDPKEEPCWFHDFAVCAGLSHGSQHSSRDAERHQPVQQPAEGAQIPGLGSLQLQVLPRPQPSTHPGETFCHLPGPGAALLPNPGGSPPRDVYCRAWDSTATTDGCGGLFSVSFLSSDLRPLHLPPSALEGDNFFSPS